MIRKTTKTALFNSLVNNERDKVIGKLSSQYSQLHVAECEDIFQNASLELWEKYFSKSDWEQQNMKSLLYKISINMASKQNGKKASHKEEPLEGMKGHEEHCSDSNCIEWDFGYISTDDYHNLKREKVYSLIDKLSATDQALIMMYLERVKVREICERLGYSSEAVVKNRKRIIVERLRKEISGQESTCPFFVAFIKRLFIRFGHNILPFVGLRTNSGLNIWHSKQKEITLQYILNV